MTFLTILFSLFSILGYIFVSHKYLKVPVSFAPLFAISSTGIMLYFFALFGLLKPATLYLQTLGIIFFLSSMLTVSTKFLKNKKNLSSSYISIYLYIITLIVFALYSLSAPMIHGDDFVFWGSVSKYIFLTDHLPIHNAPFFPEHLTYTLGAALFHYFFAFYSTIYQPSLAYTAQYALWLAPLLVVTYEKKSWDAVIAFIFALALIYLCYYRLLLNLMVDLPLSLYFFAAFYLIFAEKDIKLRHITLIPIVTFMFLIKQIGLMFAITTLVFAFFVWIYELFILSKLSTNRIAKMDSRPRENNNRKEIFLSLFPLLVCIILLFTVYYSWSWHYQHENFITFVNGINRTSMKVAILSNNQVINHLRHLFFENFLFTGEGVFKFPLLLWVIFLFSVFIYIANKKSDLEKHKIYWMLFVWGIAFIIYSLMLFFMEMITFQASLLQNQTPGLNRYPMMMLVPLLMLLFGCAINNIDLNRVKYLKNLAIFIIAIFILSLLINYHHEHKLSPEHASALKNIARIKPYLDSHKNAVVCITTSSNQKLNMAYIYELIPHKVIYLVASDLTKPSSCNVIMQNT